MCYFLKFAKDLKLGDFIYLKENDFVPADILLIDAANGLAYTDTSIIDGMSKLK